MKIKIRVSTNYVGCEDEDEIEIDSKDLVGMTEEEKEFYINEQVLEYMISNMLNYSWGEVKE